MYHLWFERKLDFLRAGVEMQIFFGSKEKLKCIGKKTFFFCW